MKEVYTILNSQHKVHEPELSGHKRYRVQYRKMEKQKDCSRKQMQMFNCFDQVPECLTLSSDLLASKWPWFTIA